MKFMPLNISSGKWITISMLLQIKITFQQMFEDIHYTQESVKRKRGVGIFLEPCCIQIRNISFKDCAGRPKGLSLFYFKVPRCDGQTH